MENIAFEIRLKELDYHQIQYSVINDILIILNDKTIEGCKYCYNMKPEATISGFRIPSGDLINCYEAFPNHVGPEEIRRNMWMCHYCYRIFQELLPDFEYIGVNNVSV